jgi:hypothetical protein
VNVGAFVGAESVVRPAGPRVALIVIGLPGSPDGGEIASSS